MSTFSGLFAGAPASPIKSIQRGTATVAANATVNVTISTIDMSKSLVLINAGVSAGNIFIAASMPAVLTSATNLKLQRYDGNSASVTVEWQVVEYI